MPAALACKEDIEERCQDVDVGQPGALLACLRRKRRELRAPCKKQASEAERWGLTARGSCPVVAFMQMQ